MNYLIDKIKSLNNTSTLISVVGGGGKTSTLFYLANLLRKDGSVLVTTTTAMFHPHENVDEVFYNKIPKGNYKNQRIGLYSGYIESKDKMTGVTKEILDKYKSTNEFDYILNEADGARKKPIKCYASYEPVIPTNTDLVIVVIGADAISKPLTEQYVHRIDEFCEVSGLKTGETITMDAIVKVLVHDAGFIKDIPKHKKAFIIINKVKSYPLDFDIMDFIRAIKKHTDIYEAVILSELKEQEILKVVEIK